MPPTLPTVFVAHGAPMLATDSVKGADYRRWAQGLPRPESILVISPHWESRGPVLTGTTQTRPLLYDFHGFPPELYELDYPAPGAPKLAQRVAELLQGEWAVEREPERPLDHGVWVPLLHMYPDADVPVLQMSLPRDRDPAGLYALGQRLAPLRGEGVLIVASGNLTHNLRELDIGDRAPPEAWASAFDQWLAERLAAGDHQALFDYRSRAPSAARAHPSDEHLTPLFIAYGAAGADARISFPIEGFEYGNLSRRCVELR